jgi:hypothetical protein
MQFPAPLHDDAVCAAIFGRMQARRQYEQQQREQAECHAAMVPDCSGAAISADSRY